eukprot:8474409-Alexandrium_andersonii.AAC.1
MLRDAADDSALAPPAAGAPSEPAETPPTCAIWAESTWASAASDAESDQPAAALGSAPVSETASAAVSSRGGPEPPPGAVSSSSASSETESLSDGQ